VSNYNPFKSALHQLSTPEAIAWYKSTAVEVFHCFCEGLLVLMAGTLYAGQLAREFCWVVYQTILEANRKPQLQLCPTAAPIALLPAQVPQHPDWDRFIRRQVKTAMIDALDWAPVEGDRVLVTAAPAAPTLLQQLTAVRELATETKQPNRRGRKPKAKK
jgi:hypothetical protein